MRRKNLDEQEKEMLSQLKVHNQFVEECLISLRACPACMEFVNILMREFHYIKENVRIG